MLIIIVLVLVIVIAIMLRWRNYGGGSEKIEVCQGDKMDLVKLEAASEKQISQFADIMSRPDNTRALGTGETWTAEKIQEFVAHAREDAAAGNSQYAHWLICADGAVVGYVSLRPYAGKQLQFRYVVDQAHRGRGYAKWAVSSLARRGHWFVVDPANAASINVALAAKAKPAGHKFISGKKYNLYRV